MLNLLLAVSPALQRPSVRLSRQICNCHTAPLCDWGFVLGLARCCLQGKGVGGV